MKHNERLISVILPTYNSAKFIKYSVNSVLAQSYSNIELIIVDDCSTDNTLKIVKNYKKKDKRIRYIRTNKNSKTAGYPRNLGIKYAKGDFIAFIDVDDYWYPNKLKYQLRYLKKKDLLSCTASNYVKESETKKSNIVVNFIRIFIQHFIFKRIKKGYLHWLYIYNPVVFSSSIVKKSLFKKIKFSENLNIREDLFFWFQVFPYIRNNFNFSGNILCTITRAKGSLSSGFKMEFNKIIHSISKDFIDKNNFSKFHFFLLGIFLRVFKVILSLIYSKFRKYILNLTLFFSLLYFVIFYSPLFWHLGNQIYYKDKFTKTESIVLISGHDKIKYINDSYQQRFFDVIEIIKKYDYMPKIIILGRNQIIPEQKILTSLLLEHGYERNLIYELLDTKQNTRQNMIYISNKLRELNIKSTTIITAPYHTLRSKLIWEKNNIQIKTSFYQNLPKKNKFFERALNKKIITYEYLSLIYNKLRGWI